MKLAAGKTICADKILADKGKYADKLVRVCGTVESVCARRGCWMRLACGDGEENLFVKFTCPVEGRLIPMEAVGHKAVVEGTLKVTEMTEADARHIAEEGGSSPAEVAKIKGPQKEVQLNAPAAVIEGVPSARSSTS